MKTVRTILLLLALLLVAATANGISFWEAKRKFFVTAAAAPAPAGPDFVGAFFGDSTYSGNYYRLLPDHDGYPVYTNAVGRYIFFDNTEQVAWQAGGSIQDAPDGNDYGCPDCVGSCPVGTYGANNGSLPDGQIAPTNLIIYVGTDFGDTTYRGNYYRLLPDYNDLPVYTNAAGMFLYYNNNSPAWMVNATLDNGPDIGEYNCADCGLYSPAGDYDANNNPNPQGGIITNMGCSAP